jgi:hypothetical protein
MEEFPRCYLIHFTLNILAKTLILEDCKKVELNYSYLSQNPDSEKKSCDISNISCYLQQIIRICH